MAVLGLRFCARAFSSCGEQGPLFIAVHWPLTIAASLVAEHRLQTRRLSICGSLAQLFRGMWNPPRPGLEPVSPASAGRVSTTVPPGKPKIRSFLSLSSIPSCSIYHSLSTYQLMNIWAVSSFQVCARFFRVYTKLYISRIENLHT